MPYEPYRLPSLECPQGPSSSFATQGRSELCLLSLFLRLEQTYLLQDFRLCFWQLICEGCWWSAGFWMFLSALDIWTQVGLESILANSSTEGPERGESKRNFNLVSHCISFCSLPALIFMLVTAAFVYWEFFFLLVSQLWFEVLGTWLLLLSLSCY